MEGRKVEEEEDLGVGRQLPFCFFLCEVSFHFHGACIKLVSFGFSLSLLFFLCLAMQSRRAGRRAGVLLYSFWSALVFFLLVSNHHRCRCCFSSDFCFSFRNMKPERKEEGRITHFIS